MTVATMAKALALRQLAGGQEGLSNQVEGCYIGDLLSWVMGRAGEGNLWLTVMGNVNAVAVAVLAGVACIVLCENATLDDDAARRADEQGVPVFQTEKNSFTLAVEAAALLRQ